MRRFELLEKEITHSKLTVAVDRTSLKVPLGTLKLIKEKYTDLAIRVQEAIASRPEMCDVTWRGTIPAMEQEYAIRMRNHARTHWATFDHEGRLVSLTDKEESDTIGT